MTKNATDPLTVPGANPDQIAQYYNANTHKFLRFGGAQEIGAIHRAIWAPGVSSRAHALLYLNQMVANAIAPVIHNDTTATQVLDLGCGVGGTAIYLARELGVNVTGITISQTQTQIAQQRVEIASVTQKVNFITGNFEALTEFVELDAVYAIESLVHAHDLTLIFERAARMLKPRGRFVLCDDFLSQQVSTRGQAWVTRFKKGWQLNSLVTTAAIEEIAKHAGFRLVESQDLTPFLRGFPAPILALMSQVTRIPMPWAYWRNLAGGTALQLCVKRGWTRYQQLIWEKC